MGVSSVDKVGHHVHDIVCITLTDFCQHLGFCLLRVCEGGSLHSKLGSPECGALHALSCPIDCTGLNCMSTVLILSHFVMISS